MIKHIVLFKLAEKAEGRSKEDNAILIKEKLESLKVMIKEIHKIEVSINDTEASSYNYDIILDSEFASFSDLEKYINHPEHKKVGEFISKVRISRAAIDYKI